MSKATSSSRESRDDQHAEQSVVVGRRDSGGLLGGSGADFVIEVSEPTREAQGGAGPIRLASFRSPVRTRCARRRQSDHDEPAVRNISLPAVLFAIGGRTHHAGQAGVANPMRDIPRFVAMLDAGHTTRKRSPRPWCRSIGMLEAYEEVAYRTTVTAIMTA